MTLTALITLSRLADAVASQATAAKALQPYAADASAQHVANLRTFHRQIGELLAAAEGQTKPAG